MPMSAWQPLRRDRRPTLTASATRRTAHRQRSRPRPGRVMSALDRARRDGPVCFSEAARERWIAVYPELSAERAGMHGAATAGGEPHAVRLALIYALLDGTEDIEDEHL